MGTVGTSRNSFKRTSRCGRPNTEISAPEKPEVDTSLEVLQYYPLFEERVTRRGWITAYLITNRFNWGLRKPGISDVEDLGRVNQHKMLVGDHDGAHEELGMNV